MKIRDLIEDPEAWKKLDQQQLARDAADEQFKLTELGNAAMFLAQDIGGILTRIDIQRKERVELGLSPTTVVADLAAHPGCRNLRELGTVNEGRQLSYPSGDSAMLNDVVIRFSGELEGFLLAAGMKPSQFSITRDRNVVFIAFA